MDENSEVTSSAEDKRAKAFKIFKQDHKAAKKAKLKGIDSQITEWNDMYYGKSKKVSKTRSSLVMKEIAKQIEFQKPNITEPFLSTSSPIRIMNGHNQHAERYLNVHFTSTFNREEFIEDMVDVKLREGTVWTRSGWKTTYKTETLEGPMELILADPRDPLSIEQDKEDPMMFIASYKVVDENHGTARVCRNEHCFPDPAAQSASEMRFFCEKRLLTLSEMKESGFYDKKALKKLEHKMSESPNKPSGSSLESSRNNDNEEYGQDLSYQTEDKARQKISIIEYWGVYDLNGDGIAEPVLASWAEHEDVDLELTDNPLPLQNIPYDVDVYSPRPFSLWGNALAYFIGSYQGIKSGIMRGVLDNMALANNGQKFIQKGAIDAINFKRMRNGESTIIVNKSDQINDGSYNNLPPAIFNILAMVSKESEDLSGASSNGPALSKDSLSKDDSNAMQMTMAQQKMAAIVRNSSNMLSKICRNWLTMAEVFLEPEQIEVLFKEEEQLDYNIFKDSNKTAIVIKVGTDVNRTIKMQQLNMLLQQSRQLGETVPPDTFNELVAEMFELFDKYDKAEELRNYKPEPSPEQQAMQQLEIQKASLEVGLLQAQIQKENALAQKAMMDGQKGMIDATAGAGYKQAQSTEKYAKAEAHKMDTSIKPAQAISQIAKDSADSKSKQQQRPSTDRRTI